VIHRDLKPSNIVILESSEDKIKILDFGIAKMVEEPGDQAAAKLTQTGEIFGSPAYMSPDQALGKELDGRSDQYSFGCVLFECLTGSPPFVGNTMVEVIMRHAGSPAPTLTEASLGKRFPAYIERAASKMLAKNAGDRFASMAEAKLALLNQPLSSFASEPKQAKRSSPLEKSLLVVALAGAVIVASCITMMRVEFPKTAPQPQPSPQTVDLSTVPDVNPFVQAEHKRLIAWIERNPTAKAFHVVILGKGDQQFFKNPDILELAKLPRLHALDLGECISINDKGITNLLAVNPPLESLNLDYTTMGNDGIKDLAKFTLLRHLSLKAVVSLTTENLAPLVNLKLERLCVARCTSLDPESLQVISKMNSLQTLDVSSTNTVGGFRYIAPMKLTGLTADDCHVSNDEIQE
ncbi:MAG: protein kinase domain-containing protein, partial [Terriglobales bacterium]